MIGFLSVLASMALYLALSLIPAFRPAFDPTIGHAAITVPPPAPAFAIPPFAVTREIDEIWARRPRFEKGLLDGGDEVLVLRSGNTYRHHREESVAQGSYRMSSGGESITLSDPERHGKVTRLSADSVRVMWSERPAGDSKRGGHEGDQQPGDGFNEQDASVYQIAKAVEYREFKALREERRETVDQWILSDSRLGQRVVVLAEPDAEDAHADLDAFDPLLEVVAVRGEGPFALPRSEDDRRALRFRLMDDGVSKTRGPGPRTAFSADGSILACETGHGLIRIWDLKRQERLLTMRTEPLSGLAMSPDGKQLLASTRHKAALVDLETSRITATLQGASLLHGAFSADGRHLVLTLLEGQCRLAKVWDARRLEVVGEFRDLGDDLTVLSFSPDGIRFAAGNERGSIRLWDLDSGDLQHTLDVGQKILALYFPDAGQVLTARAGHEAPILDYTQSMMAWDLEPMRPLYSNEYHQRVSVSPDRTCYTTVIQDMDQWRTLAFDLSTGTRTGAFQFRKEQLSGFQFLPGKRWMVKDWNQNQLRFYATESGDSQVRGSPRPGSVSAVFPLNAEMVVTRSTLHAAVELWNLNRVSASISVATLKPVRRVPGPEELQGKAAAVHRMDVSPDGKRAAVLYGDTVGFHLSLVDLKNGRVLQEQATRVMDLVYLHDQIYCPARADPTLVLDGRTLRPSAGSRLQPTKGVYVGQVLRTADRKTFVEFAPGPRIFIREVKTGHVRAEGELEKNEPFDRMAVSPDGKLLGLAALVGKPKEGKPYQTSILLLNLADGKPVGEVPLGQIGVSCLAFSSDSRFLAVVPQNDTLIRIFDSKAQQETTRFESGHTTSAARDDVAVIRYRPGSNQLITAGRDGTVRILDAASGQALATGLGHEVEVRGTGIRLSSNGVTDMVVSDDGSTLITGDWCGAVLIWDLTELDG